MSRRSLILWILLVACQGLGFLANDLAAVGPTSCVPADSSCHDHDDDDDSLDEADVPAPTVLRHNVPSALQPSPNASLKAFAWTLELLRPPIA